MPKPKPARCEDCYFRQNLLCALNLDEPCTTFRPAERGLVPERQLAFVFRTERTTAAYVYSADGRAANGDLRIQGLDGVLEQNGQRAASPERSLEWFQGLRPEELPTALPGPGTLAQTRFWARTLTDRFHEVDAGTRSLVRERAAARVAEGKPTETYRRLGPGEALQLL